MKVAIVTFEFEGISFNGGIGTAYRRLAEHLAEAGHQVTVVFSRLGAGSHAAQIENRTRKMKARLKSKAIRIVTPPRTELGAAMTHWRGATRSLEIYHYLRARDFDVIHFPDTGGLAYFSLLAKKAKVDFPRSVFIIGAHGPISWVNHGDQTYFLNGVLSDAYDRESAEMADILVSPSAYMINFLKSEGWKLPSRSLVIPNINALKSRKLSGRSSKAPSPRPLVFFGRRDPRKGVFLFTDALALLLRQNPELGRKSPLEVTFLGSEPTVFLGFETPVSEMITRRLATMKNRVRLIFRGHFSSEQALEYLSRAPESLVCVPSLVDNSPYVIVESLERGFDFLTTDSGGQGELIHPSDRARVLCRPEPHALASTLKDRLFVSSKPVRPSSLAADANRRWSSLHTLLSKRSNQRPRRSVRSPARPPLVSIVLGVSGASVPYLEESLRSARRQNYPSIEICLPAGLSVPVGSRLKVRAKTFSAISGKSPWFGAAEAAAGKYVIFLDGARFAANDSLGSLVAIAEAGGSGGGGPASVRGILLMPTKRGEPCKWGAPPAEDLVHAILHPPLPELYSLWNRRRYLHWCAETKGAQSYEDSAWEIAAAMQVAEERNRCVPVPFFEYLRPQSTDGFGNLPAQPRVLRHLLQASVDEKLRMYRTFSWMHREIGILSRRVQKVELWLSLSDRGQKRVRE